MFVPRPVAAALLLLAAGSSARAQDIKRYAPKPPPEAPTADRPKLPELPSLESDTAPLIPELKGIVFVPNQEAVSPAGLPEVRGIHYDGLEVPAPKEFERIAAARLGKPLSLGAIRELTRELILFWRAHDRPVMDVVVPEQDITSGVLQLIVIESRLGKVRVEGARWFSAEKLSRKLRVQPGDRIAESVLNADLNWLNKNPFRSVNLIYTPGTAPGTTDLVLKTEDHFPLRVYAGYDDSGSAPTVSEAWMRDRWQAGFNWGNAFGADQLLSYQFTTGDDFRNLLAHSVNYSIPLPWRHLVSFSGSRSDSESNSVGQIIRGQSWGASFRYGIPLPGNQKFSETVLIGFDFSRSNSNLDFGGLTQYNKPIELRQFAVDYQAALTDSFGTTSFTVSGVYSPGEWGAANSDFRFDTAQPNGSNLNTAGRSGADSNYYYGRLSLERLTQLPWEWSLATRGSAQAASGPLLMGGQLYLGGWDSVRGYEPGDAHGDEGCMVSFELRAPSLSLGRLLRWKAAPDQVQFLGFWDYGSVAVLHPLPGEDVHAERSGAGVGVRVNITQSVSFRFDYAWQLVDPGLVKTVSSAYSSRAYLGFTMSY